MTKKTPLYDEHVQLGAKMVDFEGWAMPVQYTGVMEEHRAVRSAAGLFDISHMGVIGIGGPNVLQCVQHLTSNDIQKVKDGQAQYSLLINERGTIVDDVIIYRHRSDGVAIVVNSANHDKDLAWIKEHCKADTKIVDQSHQFAIIALQGPCAAEILQACTDMDLSSLKPFWFLRGMIIGKNAVVARTGYTGEDGFEILVEPHDVVQVWRTLLEKGVPFGIVPVGLGARDTLRLEMRYSLYGHEISEDTNPFEAGLGWVVSLDKQDDFLGKNALKELKAKGNARKLIGFELCDRGIPRQGYTILGGEDHRNVGAVTSGTLSPSIGKAIGMGYVDVECSKIGSKIFIDIRGSEREATVVKTPFYKRKKRGGVMNFPDNLKYTKEHEWVRVEGDRVTIGVTDFAQEQFGDIVYVELPTEGEGITKEETFGVIESVKAVSDCYAPVTGKVADVNTHLVDNPETINEDPYGEGWMVSVELNDKSEVENLMSAEEYGKFVKEESA